MRDGLSQEPSIEPQIELTRENLIREQDGDSKSIIVETNNSKTTKNSNLHNVIIHPRLKPAPFKIRDAYPTDLPKPTEICTVNDLKFYQNEELPVNRRGFKYKLCKPNPIFTSNYYSTTDIEPYEVSLSWFDRSTGSYLSQDCKALTSNQGWRSVRSNVGIREGIYYFEFKILKSDDYSHVRIGLGRREASIEAPVGFDGYGYGIRDVGGELVFISRRKNVLIEEGFKTGDVIGFEVHLPSLSQQKKEIEEFVNLKKSEIPDHHTTKKRKTNTKNKKFNNIEDNEKFNEFNNILRDQIPTKSKGVLYYDQFEYTKTKMMDHLLNPITVFGEKAIIEMDDKTKNIPIISNSKIVLYKNGVKQNETIENLYSFLPTNLEEIEEINLEPNLKQQSNPNYKNNDDNTLGYYPMLSTFQNGAVSLNAGPEFEYPPENTQIKPLSDRYNEHVIEEWYWDIIDEVEAQYLDSFD
ncbi:ASH2 [Candida pseudojiufengensis]|uniref:ASH2 n=1 Tax=Candida pseudojiufengensis TaxID=497109 RepID=UPI0022250F5A|nr:ASH2 [Candida pseudojiufengensis]KAI5958713.1 ASH2 [Candida pseudojiufengensis]